MLVYKGMKKIMKSSVLAFLLIISFTQVSHAQVATTSLSADDKASIIAELQQEIHDLLVQLIAQLQAELSAQIASSTPVVVSQPLVGAITQPVMSDSLGIGEISTSTVNKKIVGTVPLVINANNYVGGVARVKGVTDPSVDWGVSWQRGYAVPSFEGLASGDYSFTIKLYNRPYNETNQGKDTDTVAEQEGQFTIPAK